MLKYILVKEGENLLVLLKLLHCQALSGLENIIPNTDFLILRYYSFYFILSELLFLVHFPAGVCLLWITLADWVPDITGEDIGNT